MKKQSLPFLEYKIIFIAFIIPAYFILIIGRLYYLQIMSHDHFSHRSTENFLRYETNNPIRGNIVDCHNQLLATNKPQVHLCWKGSGKRKLSEEQLKKLELIQFLSHQDFLSSHESIEIAERKQNTVRLVANISFGLLTSVVEQFPNDENIVLETDYTRYYPHNFLASHALGYLGILNITSEGKMGLEKWCEKHLQGHKGYTEKFLNSFGKTIQTEEIQASQTGGTIQVTLDLGLQTIAEESYPQEYKGALILIESETGKIRSLLSRPSFDPNIFSKRIDQETWTQLQEHQPFLNRIFTAGYPPGSLFKIITLTTALETNMITTATECMCKGFVRLGIRKFHCNKKTGHGKMPVRESLAQSCNTLFFLLGKTLDIDLLADYASRFGLGKNVNQQFNDNPGLLPTRLWKRKTKKEPWWQGETFSATIGQSFILVTPLQIAQMFASIETGFLTQPHILEDQEVIRTPLNVSTETRQFLKSALYETIYYGTGRELQRIKNIEMYAKTSTAQISSLEKSETGEEQYKEHRWLAINFKYEDNPWMTLIILVERAPEKRACTKIALNFLKEYKKHIKSINKMT